MQFIDLKTQYQRIENNVINRITAVLNHNHYIMGPEIEELEHKLSHYIDVKHSVAVSSGTDALLIALMALDIQKGDEIITSPFSFFATAEVIALLGAKPVFVDIDPDTYNLDASGIEEMISEKTKAIMAVSLYGQCADFDEINRIAEKHKLPVIEDAAQSFGATYKEKKSCGLTTIGCTSFFPSKPLGCYGDGGACFTNDDEIAQKMKEIRNHGQSARYSHTRIGINGRMDTIQAAILLEKMSLFPEEVRLRQMVADNYNSLLNDSVNKPMIKSHNTSVYAQYTMKLEHREYIQTTLSQKGIPTAIHYPVGLQDQPIFKTLFPHDNIRFPNTEDAARQVLSLPMHPYLGIDDQKVICNTINAALLEVNK